METKKLALFDLDGTLANDLDRSGFATRGEWAEYFSDERMLLDPAYSEGRVILEDYMAEPEWGIAYLTGRRFNRYETSLQWLAKNNFPFAPLFMKQNDSAGVSLAEFKVQKIRWMLETYNLDDVVLYDNNPSVIEAVKKAFGAKAGVLCEWQLDES